MKQLSKHSYDSLRKLLQSNNYTIATFVNGLSDRIYGLGVYVGSIMVNDEVDKITALINDEGVSVEPSRMSGQVFVTID